MLRTSLTKPWRPDTPRAISCMHLSARWWDVAAARGILRSGGHESRLPISRIHLSRPPCAGRYNSLDLASKDVCQRRAPPSLGIFPDADSTMFIAGEYGRCCHLFSCKCRTRGTMSKAHTCMKTGTRREFYGRFTIGDICIIAQPMI